MADVRDLYLDVADAAVTLLTVPEVAAKWEEPSALAQFSVRGLAGHLAAQAFILDGMLAEPAASEPVITVHQYYERAAWIGSDLDTEFNQGIRAGGEELAAEGPDKLAARTAAVIARQRGTLRTAPDRAVRRPTWGPWSITLDDFVLTRTLELIIHSDDLAYSVGVQTPEFRPEAVQAVVDVLARIALRRHGQTAVLRALSRAERAPSSIAAL